ncbi:MAG: zinc-binding dehydrogenase [SAR86 cluster bacterium]|uniref:Zinc-binding dehydrogenase n=1 Tax=SAR86 cluster bacterium TaxID=2030880 RepID=A0A973A9S6_9GAMM|nr:zinc-binding dehydrogenase [SAR86 cluster bacterium]|tara:strand:- start:229 stop:1203 length:975 start_codon:yes stop_codon:yes gene_type:complete
MRQWWVVPGDTGGEFEYRDVEMPAAGPGQVLIRVCAAGVNRGELLTLPAMRLSDTSAKPRRSGIEFAGKIVALGAETAGWSIGDRVMGRGAACHAEFVVSSSKALMRAPEGLSFAQAAAIPNVFVTAHDALVSAAAVKKGETVLVTAGSSGVGSAAIQIARYLGAKNVLATTRSGEKNSALTALGATHIVNTNTQNWSAEVRDAVDAVDVVIDQVGGVYFPYLLETMAVGGRFISVGRNGGRQADLDLDLMSKNRLVLIGVTFRTRTPSEAQACSDRFVDDLLPAFTSGELRAVLDRSFPLEQLPEALAYMEADQQVGKIVLCA